MESVKKQQQQQQHTTGLYLTDKEKWLFWKSGERWRVVKGEVQRPCLQALEETRGCRCWQETVLFKPPTRGLEHSPGSQETLKNQG